MARRSVESELEPDLASTGVESDLTSTEFATSAFDEDGAGFGFLQWRDDRR